MVYDYRESIIGEHLFQVFADGGSELCFVYNVVSGNDIYGY